MDDYKGLDYKERLVLLDTAALELRMLKIALINVYNSLFVLLDIDFNDYFAFNQDGASRGSYGHNYCLSECNGRVDARCNYFAFTTVKSWNSLLVSTIIFNYSLSSLKRTLNSIVIVFVCQMMLN